MLLLLIVICLHGLLLLLEYCVLCVSCVCLFMALKVSSLCVLCVVVFCVGSSSFLYCVFVGVCLCVIGLMLGLGIINLVLHWLLLLLFVFLFIRGLMCVKKKYCIWHVYALSACYLWVPPPCCFLHIVCFLLFVITYVYSRKCPSYGHENPTP